MPIKNPGAGCARIVLVWFGFLDTPIKSAKVQAITGSSLRDERRSS